MIELPDDENGDILRRMIAHGDDLSRPRIVDFTQVFPDEASAQAFADRVRLEGLVAEVERTDVAEDLPWDVVIEYPLAPSHTAIAALELKFSKLAGRFGGRIDGWGCENVVADEPLMRVLP
jgi:hypothetical protein